MPRAMRRAVLATYKCRKPSDVKIAPAYLLGTGHELFFIDKCAWLYARWLQLRNELVERDYDLGEQFQTIVRGRARFIRRHGSQFYGNYQPTADAEIINRQRIQERLA